MTIKQFIYRDIPRDIFREILDCKEFIFAENGKQLFLKQNQYHDETSMIFSRFRLAILEQTDSSVALCTK